MPMQVLKTLLLEHGLYEIESASDDQAFATASHLSSTPLRLDAFCPRCGESSTFSASFTYKLASTPSRHNVVLFYANNLSHVTMRCARNEAHRIEFMCRLEVVKKEEASGEGAHVWKFRKIGQDPSYADLLPNRLQRYKRIADRSDLNELQSARILEAHGFHVGAFTYLRRVFERLLENAHLGAAGRSGWDESTYQKSRVTDRVKMLEAQLPAFMVENRGVYGVLSKGVHTLTDEECAEAFPVLEASVTMMLDEELAARERAERQKEVAAAFQSLQGKYRDES